jgi:signal transduction histidine kinase
MGLDPSLAQPADGEPGHEAVFDAFRRGANVIAAGIPGTGLGLSIVREVVEQAGGRIIVSSRPGQGSSFTVAFQLLAPRNRVRSFLVASYQ